MKTMRTIAEFGDYSIVQSLAGLIYLYDGHYTNYDSAYQAICAVPDLLVRAELLKLWGNDLTIQEHAEKATAAVESVLQGVKGGI